jgi:hypothetical protein
VPETVIAGVLLLHARSVDEIVSKPVPGRSLLPTTRFALCQPLVYLVPAECRLTSFVAKAAQPTYDYYLIELQQSDRGWRVLRIAHCLSEARSFSPACVYHRDRAAAEEGGRALIDARLSEGRRFKKPQLRTLGLERGA